ncbi:MAG: M18 family aminopeptidase [Chlamydiia bacterium]|nr:M18 family aminopeptidase [Chlamydiia bacterium]
MTHDPLNDLLLFLTDSPTPWHATQEIGNRLAQQDATPLSEKEKWELKPGASYFVERGGSLCAFTLPKDSPEKATILATHTDSPALKLKPNPIFIENGLPFIHVETYGSPILSTWMNRDLVIAGRFLLSENDTIIEQLVLLDHAPVMIPSLAIHLDRDVNDKPTKIDKQRHLCPLLGIKGKNKKPEKIFEELTGIKHQDLLGADLYLVPFEKPRLIGLHTDIISSYRIDNLASAHASLLALLGAKKCPKHTIQMAIFYNHEEIGSETNEGASSPFLDDILKRISLSYHINEEDHLRMKNRSLCISIDMAHAIHPNYIEKYDQDNAPEMGEGVVIKHNANHRYATSGMSGAHITRLCQKLNIPYQTFASESNLPCGSTVGAITAARTGIETVDIGLAQLSMHAARELISAADHLHLCRLLKSSLES